MRYLYSIAGLRILCSIPFPITIQREAVPFLSPAPDRGETEDLTFAFQSAAALPPVPADAFFTQDRYYASTGYGLIVHHCPAPGTAPYACVSWDNENRFVLCNYLPGSEERMHYSRSILDLLGAETLLTQFQGLLLHASFIQWRGKGILFSAPSGTGKSTQAELWKYYESADILNGDRAAVRRDMRGWTAYGLPYAGSSGIYRNDAAPVSAIVVLSQAKENRIRKLSVSEAIRFLYPEIVLHRWDTADVEQALNLLTVLAAEVPILLLECLPDRGAVQAVKEFLMKKDQEGGGCEWSQSL